MTLEIYKPRTERNNKQLNKTLTETVHCPPASSELKQYTCQWNTTHFYKKYLNLVMSLPLFGSFAPALKGPPVRWRPIPAQIQSLRCRRPICSNFVRTPNSVRLHLKKKMHTLSFTSCLCLIISILRNTASGAGCSVAG
jgi:hypothetical protein